MPQSNESTTAQPPAPLDAPSATVRWKLLAACSHSSAVAVGQRARLAFRFNGLHAFGGYIEGFLPATFANEAVASDDRILTFLQLSNDAPALGRGKDRFVLSRGEVEVRFEAAADVPLPTFPELTRRAKELKGLDLKQVRALLDSVPKTGWGALNAEMLGIIVTPEGIISTDNTCMGWGLTETPHGDLGNTRLVLPRPFCLALLEWAEKLGKEFTLKYLPTGVLAEWAGGAKLYGSLPTANVNPIEFGALCEELRNAVYTPQPEHFRLFLDEAAIFSEDLIIELKGKTLNLSTPGEISWHRQTLWAGEDGFVKMPLPLKRLRTAVEYTDEIAWGAGRVYLRTQTQDLYIVISAKGGTE